MQRCLEVDPNAKFIFPTHDPRDRHLVPPPILGEVSAELTEGAPWDDEE